MGVSRLPPALNKVVWMRSHLEEGFKTAAHQLLSIFLLQSMSAYKIEVKQLLVSSVYAKPKVVSIVFFAGTLETSRLCLKKKKYVELLLFKIATQASK